MSHYTWKPVALHLCLLLQQQGFTLDSADNGEEEIKTGNIDELVDNLTACDEARLYVSRPFENGGTKKLALDLVFGNEPHETVADYTVDKKLEAALELFEDFWSRRRTPLAEAEASWLEEVRGVFGERPRGKSDGPGCPVLAIRPSDRPTPRTDEHIRQNGAVGLDQHACTLERELVEARDLNDTLTETLKQTREKYGIGERNVMKELEAKVASVTEQRDRMAAFIQHQLDFNNLIESVHDEARQLLFSVEGGSTPSPNWHALYQEARARIEDMLKGDDGQAWEEVRKFITRKGGAQ